MSLRFKEPRNESEEFDAKAKELALELDVEILKATTEEELSTIQGGELGKRENDDNHMGFEDGNSSKELKMS